MTNALTRRVIDVLAQHAPARRPHWESMLTHALETEPAVFARPAFSDYYRDLAANADWFADSLIANACLEGYGSQQILLFANRLADAEHAQLARRHALDESRHATVFVLALDLVFPGLLASQDEQVRAQVRAMQPFMKEADIQSGRHDSTIAAANQTSPYAASPYAASPEAESPEAAFPCAASNEAKSSEAAPSDAMLSPADAIADIIQIHLTEIRALVLQDLVREAFMRHAPPAHLQRLMRISDRLIADEGRHIAYCADIIEQAALQTTHASSQLHEAFALHMRNFNNLTRDELERQCIEI